MRERSKTDQARTGALDVARAFLANQRLFEVDKKFKPGARPIGFIDDRKVRMIATPREMQPVGERTIRDRNRTETLRENERLQNEIEHLKDQIALFRAAMIGFGHEDRADEIAPPSEEVDNDVTESRRPWR
jgi:hypothetical protein